MGSKLVYVQEELLSIPDGGGGERVVRGRVEFTYEPQVDPDGVGVQAFDEEGARIAFDAFDEDGAPIGEPFVVSLEDFKRMITKLLEFRLVKEHAEERLPEN